jgi:hypothetical protein
VSTGVSGVGSTRRTRVATTAQHKAIRNFIPYPRLREQHCPNGAGPDDVQVSDLSHSVRYYRESPR